MTLLTGIPASMSLKSNASRAASCSAWLRTASTLSGPRKTTPLPSAITQSPGRTVIEPTHDGCIEFRFDNAATRSCRNDTACEDSKTEVSALIDVAAEPIYDDAGDALHNRGSREKAAPACAVRSRVMLDDKDVAGVCGFDRCGTEMALGEPTVGCLQFDRENAAGKLLICLASRLKPGATPISPSLSSASETMQESNGASREATSAMKTD